MALLEVSDVGVYYGQVQALKDVSLDVERGEIVGVIGPNGAGKTTLLNAISGLKSYEGDITFDGQPLSEKSTHEIVERGLIHCPESRDLYPFLDVEENLRMGAFARGRDQITERLETVYELFPRLEERRSQNAITLSGGEQQMLAIGRSLVGDPVLLMIDEPTLGLAPVIIDRISDSLERLSDDGLTVLLMEQNSTFAFGHADRLYLLETGTIEMSGTPAEFREREYIQDAYIGVS